MPPRTNLRIFFPDLQHAKPLRLPVYASQYAAAFSGLCINLLMRRRVDVHHSQGRTKQFQQLIRIIRFRQQRPRNAQRLDWLRTFFHLQREVFRRFRLILQHHSTPILPRFSSLLPEPALPYEGEHALSRHMASHFRHALRHRFVRKDFQQHRVSTAYAAVNLPPCLLLRIIYS